MTFICRSNEDLIDLIERFGKPIVMSMFFYNIIKFNVSNENLREYYKHSTIEDIEHEQLPKNKAILYHLYDRFYKAFIIRYKKKFALELPENKAILMRLYDRFYKAFVIRYKKKFEGINLKTDPITGKPIVDPIYISTEWNMNYKIVYSLDTILKFCSKNRIYTRNATEEYHNDALDYDYFISRYTGTHFTFEDIRNVNMDLLEN